MKKHLRADLTARDMASDEPPQGYSLLLFPPTIIGYNMLHKTWSDLYVDYIYDIDWNKQAFRDLVVDDEIKELVQALVTRQIETRKSTDSISGKGNGLILLLHGAPGTGKTFTAEGVAEFAEKPLFRVTCGDVGIEATKVEEYLQAAFRLGKLWDCVVLLDEADVFLEERDVKDLNRNAVVSVFLRALEYHDGILILTSNRVGTFDEAFKSRIQLALHYDNLTLSQRRKIWRNFMNRLRTVDAENVDFDDILDHLDELGNRDINGREIRNAITIARQLAQFKNEKFCYSHLDRVLRVSGKFGKYLRDLRDGLTDDHIKHDLGVRHSYRVWRSNSIS
jgi:SpoVK/Ycf46/Vps4 family AAA+-type ATPase